MNRMMKTLDKFKENEDLILNIESSKNPAYSDPHKVANAIIMEVNSLAG